MDKIRGKGRGRRKIAPEPTPAPESGGIWTIGPIINGKNYSVGMPETIVDTFDFPTCSNPISPQGPSVHYVTKPAEGPLSGSMSVTLEITGDAEFTATEGSQPRARLYFQRRGDNWTARSPYDAYRWYSPFTVSIPMTPGVHTLSVPLTRDRWGSVMGTPTEAEFEAAKRDAAVVGFVFGGTGGAGHGVCLLSGQARCRIVDFRIG